MKKYVVLCGMITLVTVFYWSCTKVAPPSASPSGCSVQFANDTVTYNNYVHRIVTTYCTPTCHNGGATGPGNFSTYQGILPYVNLFPSYVISDNAIMPQGNAPLPKSIRDSLNIWIQNCTPQ